MAKYRMKNGELIDIDDRIILDACGTLPPDGAVIVNFIFETTNYSAFTFLRGNRDIEPPRIETNRRSLKILGPIIPGVVNENMEIGDGQARFTVAQQDIRPFRFMIHPGFDMKASRIINCTSERWHIPHFIKSRADEGDMTCKTFLSLLNTFDNVREREEYNLVYASIYGCSMPRGKITQEEFIMGRITEDMYKQAFDRLKIIDEFLSFWSGTLYSRKVKNVSTIALALLYCDILDSEVTNVTAKLMLKEGFKDENRFSKFSYMSGDLYLCLGCLEEMYNWKRGTRSCSLQRPYTNYNRSRINKAKREKSKQKKEGISDE